MQSYGQHKVIFTMLALGLVLVFVINISLGPVKIPFMDVLQSLTGSEASKSTWQYIIVNYRLPKAITALVAGVGLSVSGLLMQTLFRNPLAGPDVLGLSSGASLGVAFTILGAGILPGTLSFILLSSYGVVIAASLGSLLVLLAIITVAQRLRDTMALLIVGVMFTSFTSAIVGILTYFSTAEQLQKFTFWAMGSLGNLSWNDIAILTTATIAGVIMAITCIKPLDALLLGERYAASMGVNFNKTRFLLILATSILTGSITAFAGPIAFIALVVPHAAKLLFKTGSHFVLFWATVLIGATLLLICDTFTQLPGTSFVLPINAVTSVIGAPAVIALILNRKKGIFN